MSNVKTTKKRIIIPSRLESTRLPNKPLLDICGKPMIQHVYERALKCNFSSVVIATDSEKVRDIAEGFGAQVCMTSKNHASGTDRLSEAVNILGYADEDVIVNLQGDEPLIPIDSVLDVTNSLINNKLAEMSTLCEEIDTLEEVFNPNNVKVVLDKNSYALYFSRSAIPWDRATFPHKINTSHQYYKHIGLYAYRASFLKDYFKLNKSTYESIEMLEQLRILWHGYKIYVGVFKGDSVIGVDTDLDLERVRSIFKLRY